jgi:hypothetical protein
VGFHVGSFLDRPNEVNFIAQVNYSLYSFECYLKLLDADVSQTNSRKASMALV